MNWYLEVLKKYAVFDGRAQRKEFWPFSFINLIVLLSIAGVKLTSSQTYLISFHGLKRTLFPVF
jgi:uncharacterized membrane protein YhaH (DUF805 family)